MNYRLPCAEGVCPTYGNVDAAAAKLCTSVSKMILQAGGAGIFEATPCAQEAVSLLAEDHGIDRHITSALLDRDRTVEIDPTAFEQ